jgi:hypothetical protein
MKVILLLALAFATTTVAAERKPDRQGLALNGNLSLNPRQVLNVHRAR